MVVAFFCLQHQLQQIGDEPPGAFDVFWLMAQLGLAAGLAMHTAQVVALAVMVLIARGPGCISWQSPSRCRSLTSWILFDWDFFSNTGRQTGMRFLGLEVATAGKPCP